MRPEGETESHDGFTLGTPEVAGSYGSKGDWQVET